MQKALINKILTVIFLLIIIAGCSRKIGDVVKEKMNISDNQILTAVMKTNMGDITIQLFPKETPKTVENFVGLSLQNYYDGITFHRVIKNFMLQGGDPTGTGSGGNSYFGHDFEDEFRSDLQFDTSGILAMANRGPSTNSSQFFITTVPTEWLNGKHTIFGKVIDGMDVVNAISNVAVSKPFDKPVKDVIIEGIEIEKKDK